MVLCFYQSQNQLELARHGRIIFLKLAPWFKNDLSNHSIKEKYIFSNARCTMSKIQKVQSKWFISQFLCEDSPANFNFFRQMNFIFALF